MDPIASINVPTAAPLRQATVAPSAPAIPAPASAAPAPAELSSTESKIAQAELQRLQAVEEASRAAANPYPISDRRFTIFKDMNGEYVTRYTSLRDGQVTYMPEPQLLKHYSPALPSIRLDV